MKSVYKTAGFSLVICRNPERKWLVVEETRNRGFWLPGGSVEPGEPFHDAAIRETKEEAGIDIELVGVLRVEYADCFTYLRLKTIYFAVPKDPTQKPKEIPDSESLGARWCDEKELAELDTKQMWRGPELLYWSSYLNNGGVIYPPDNMQNEGYKATTATDSVSKADKWEFNQVTPHKINDVKTSYFVKPSSQALKIDSEAICTFLEALALSDESWFLLKEAKKIFNSVCEESGNTMLHLAIRTKSSEFIKNCIFISESAVLTAKNESGLTALMLWKQSDIDSGLIALLTQKAKSKLDNSNIKLNEI